MEKQINIKGAVINTDVSCVYYVITLNINTKESGASTITQHKKVDMNPRLISVCSMKQNKNI
jgi:hypothetical protein